MTTASRQLSDGNVLTITTVDVVAQGACYWWTAHQDPATVLERLVEYQQSTGKYGHRALLAAESGRGDDRPLTLWLVEVGQPKTSRVLADGRTITVSKRAIKVGDRCWISHLTRSDLALDQVLKEGDYGRDSKGRVLYGWLAVAPANMPDASITWVIEYSEPDLNTLTYESVGYHPKAPTGWVAPSLAEFVVEISTGTRWERHLDSAVYRTHEEANDWLIQRADNQHTPLSLYRVVSLDTMG